MTAIDDLRYVIRAMNGVSAKWQQIALRFKLAGGKTDGIKSRLRKDPDRCLLEVIAEWLQSDAADCTWRSVVCAIAARVGGDNPSEAEKVAKEYQSMLQSVSFPMIMLRLQSLHT